MVARGLRFVSLSIVAVIIGAVVFSIRPDVPRAALERDYAGGNPAYVTLPSGARAHYRDEGNFDGPTLLLLHGSHASLHTWDEWVAELGDHYRIVRLDLPGHGLTGRMPGDTYDRYAMVEFVRDFVIAMELERFDLAGHEMGGGVAWAFARRYGEYVSHLVLVAPTGIGRVPQDPPLAVTLAQNPATRPLLRWLSPRWIFANALYEGFVDDNFVTPERVDRYWRLNRLAGNRIANARRLSLVRAPDLGEMEGAIEAPTAIIWGEEDQILPFDRDRITWDLRTKFAGGPQENPLYTFDGVGHYPHVERADLTAAFAANFIETHPVQELAE